MLWYDEGRGGVAIVLSHQLRKAEGGGPTATTTVCPLPPRPRPVETAETGLVSAGAFYQTRVGCQAVTITAPQTWT